MKKLFSIKKIPTSLWKQPSDNCYYPSSFVLCVNNRTATSINSSITARGSIQQRNFKTRIGTFQELNYYFTNFQKREYSTMIASDTNGITTGASTDTDVSSIPKRPVIQIDYRNKVILAPMVRVNGLPFRRLAAQYGADIVYSEELVDKKLLKCKPVYNEKLKTIDYISEKDKSIVYQVEVVDKDSDSPTASQKVPTVLQLGTSSPEIALKVAELMIDGYDAIDVNMGCPKKFSVKGGMGSALLRPENQENALEILRTLVKGIQEKYGKPVTCKIRLLDSPEQTLELFEKLQNTGVTAICVHARYIPQRPREKAHSHLIEPISKIAKVPLIANGDVFKPEDIERVKSVTGCSSVMIARGAMWNLSIFRKEKVLLDKLEVAKILLDEFIKYQYPAGLSKYIIKRMFETHAKTNLYKRLVGCKGYDDLHKAIHFNDGEDLNSKELSIEQITSIPEDDDVLPITSYQSTTTVTEPFTKKQKYQ
ncbi:hypothetical protein C9374_003322 [Naegleria lovaniensis]|uniref:DUS-like FMN-binding domain-containing protein n=1 Tax=Naegleria lovaniensis TaxID=51637 RepID=A0AA88GMN9_NAELO|nr:uncharacterized protein C9374_003322 [Naegleria lovaniensis]KAG2385507.1 hypothetical protein C9374_003322 [Naegleria lovaniensis]